MILFVAVKGKKKKKPALISRAYPQINLANQAKIDSAWALFLLYRADAEKLNQYQKRLFFQELKISKLALKLDGLLAPERFRQTAQYQVVDQINSYLGKLKKDFPKYVFKAKLTQDSIHKLCYINKAGLWQYKPSQLKKTVHKKLSPKNKSQLDIEVLFKIAKSLFKRLRKKNKWPACKNWTTMMLDAKVAIISLGGGCIGQSKKRGKATLADYWLQLSTYERGSFIQIPIGNSPRFKKAQGRRSNNSQIHFKKDGSMQICFFRKRLKKLKSLPQIAKYLRIDDGLNCRLATDQGDLLGQGYKKQLDYYDVHENNLKKELKKRKLPFWENERWKNLSRIRTEYIKNETGRNTNKLITIHHPDILESEALNFQGSDLSKQMNRHLHRYGQGIMACKLDCFIEEGKLVLHLKKHAAYTSKTCYKCGYVDKKNRNKKNRDIFICLACGGKAHADVNAAKNVGVGSSNLGAKRSSILKALMATSVANLKRMPLSQGSLRAILANPYYVDYHKHFQIRLKKSLKKRPKKSLKEETHNKGRSLSLEKGGSPYLAGTEHQPCVNVEDINVGGRHYSRLCVVGPSSDGSSSSRSS